MKYVRTTHRNGRFKKISPEANRFWHTAGAAVGEALRSETPMTAAEVVAACREYAEEFPDGGSQAETGEAYVAWCLRRLVELGLAREVE